MQIMERPHLAQQKCAIFLGVIVGALGMQIPSVPRSLLYKNPFAGELELLQYVCGSQQASSSLHKIIATSEIFKGNNNHHSPFRLVVHVCWAFCTKT